MTRGKAPDYDVGYAKAPKTTRFRKGQSGNPRGRPPGSRGKAPYETVLGQTVTVHENGQSRRIGADEAFLLHLTRSGLAGDISALQVGLGALESVRGSRGNAEELLEGIVFIGVYPENADQEMRHLGMTIKVDRFRPTARMLIEPWLVQAALDRMEDRQLIEAEQREVIRATRTPRKVTWPAWWTEFSG